MHGGTPNSFNGINTFTESAGITERTPYLSIYPPPTFGGKLYYNDSVVDWFRANANYTTWTFNVRPGLKWSDGTNVTSQDIVNTYSKQFALNATADAQGLRFEITSVVPLNSSAAEFMLNKSDAHLPERLGGILYTNVMPASFVAKGAFFNGFDGIYPADGPFYIDDYSSGNPQAILLRNPYYTPSPKICKFVVDYVESQSEVSTLVQAGTADLGVFVPYPDVSNILAHNPSLHLLDEKNTVLFSLLYNVTKYPYNMTAFRQALAYGINETQLVQQGVVGYGTEAYSAQGGVPPSQSWYSPNQTTYSYNTTKALQLLKSIGMTKNSNGQLTYPNGTVISLALWATSDLSAGITDQTIIQQNLNALGFNINVVPATLGANLIADSYSNTNGENSALVVSGGSEGCVFGLPFLDALPIYQVCIPEAAPPTWLEPPSAQHEYQSNLTAITGTADPTLEYKYLSNIQALNSQYLPEIVLNYADAPVIYSTARWTNWPPHILDGWAIELNSTALSQLQPVNASTTSSTALNTTSSLVSSSTSSVSSSSSSPASIVTTTVTATASSASSQGNTLLYVATAVVVIVIIGAAVAVLRRRRPPHAA